MSGLGLLSPALLFFSLRTYAGEGHFDNPAREYLRHEYASCLRIKANNAAKKPSRIRAAKSRGQ
jgi:hypothetical protein